MSHNQNQKSRIIRRMVRFCGILILLLSSCTTQGSTTGFSLPPQITLTPTPYEVDISERPKYSPGELVEYTAQSGDTIPNLAFRFNTTIEEILAENPIIPEGVTTLPPGLPLSIPIYYQSLWGSQFQILPNCAFVNGPAQIDFDIAAFVESQPGWFKDYQQYAAEQMRSGAEIITYISNSFSINPKILLALLEYQIGALSTPKAPDNLIDGYPLGYEESGYHGLYIQLVWAANTLNQGYYGWLANRLDTIEFSDQTIEHPDPWQNAATVGLQYYFSQIEDKAEYQYTINPDGFLQTYQELFQDPWNCDPLIPGSLQQPKMRLPFEPGKSWAYTGGPHTGWGRGDPWAALDFAPPSAESSCEITSEWALATAPGIITRSETGLVELDLDGDGDHRTGWVVLYLHLGKQDKVRVGTQVQAGDPIGHPSCEGGESTGAHIHIARKYNGEWIPAAGVLPFIMDDWIPKNGSEEYQGTMTRFTETVIASVDAEEKSIFSAPTPIP
jgi:murein DD-endopeptidase MepM/ murein hydrolase activator NlpD